MKLTASSCHQARILMPADAASAVVKGDLCMALDTCQHAMHSLVKHNEHFTLKGKNAYLHAPAKIPCADRCMTQALG